MKRYFLTGTDTDAGKTLISAALLLNAEQQGKSAFGLKPVASGCELTDAGLRNRDALLHQQYSAGDLPYHAHNPLAFAPAIAPHIAALQAGTPLSVAMLSAACADSLTTSAELQLIEGAGGWLVPLNDDETLADFASTLTSDVILVVGLRLGCINHACLTAEAIRARGMRVAGWVANGIDPDMEAQQENLRYLHHWFSQRGIEHLGTVPHMAGIDPFVSQELAVVASMLRWPQ